MNYQLRFNHKINDFEESKYYFINRSKQTLFDSFKIDLNGFEDLGWGCKSIFYNINDINKIYFSIYVYEQYRNQNKMKLFCKQHPEHVFITVPDCNIEDWFTKNKIKHIVVANHINNFYYRCISNFYYNKCAKRSKIQYMNHIDEGLFILKKINASEDAIGAFCLHPLVQRDEDLKENYEHNKMLLENNAKHLLLATEYRSVANEYLAHNLNINNSNEIRISPLKEVNDMLIADKIQNYKDFILYHKNTHPNSKQLEKYFKLWLEKLNISNKMFEHFFNLLL